MSGLTNPTLGVSIAVAIAIHNIPEGIAVSVPLYYATGDRKKAFMYSFLSGLAEPVGALVGYLIFMQFFNEVVFGLLFASVAGAFMYFATLTEVPILEGLIGNGMGKGPALALLLAGPALSLPNMLVIASVLGWRKTSVFVSLVVVMSTIAGVVFGSMF